jgi:hypothetical protein
MQSENPIEVTELVPERRGINRVHTAVPVTINIVGAAGPPPPVTVQTANISPRGIATIMKIRLKVQDGRVSIHEEAKDLAKIVKYLASEDRIVGLGIRILPKGGSIDALGTVKWHASLVSKELYAVRTGIFLDEIDRAQRKEWLYFLRAIYEHLTCFSPELEDTRGPMTPLYPVYPG